MRNHNLEVPVLIVGGSLVGMSTAVLLGQHGVRTLVVERHRGTAIHPRAALIYQRSMEILRSMGIEQTVLQKSYEQFEPDGAIMSVETLAGKELNWDVAHLNDGVRDLSPTERLFISQIGLEPMLKTRAEELGTALRYGTEMISFEEDSDGVTAVIRERDTGETFTVRASYMVAADGAHSRVRNLLGIRMLGHGVLSKSVTIYFRASVGPLMRGRNLSVILVRNPTFRGFFRIEKPYESGFLIVHMLGDPDDPVTDVWDLTEERCRELVRVGLGADDVPIAIDDVQRWECAADVAERYRQGRIFLAGDAAHAMPPYGGFGGNTGIHDAHNIAWKLALVLKGIAGPELLSTYEPERRPVAEFTVDQAYLRYVVRAALYLATEGMQQRFVRDPNIDLGYCYHSAAVIPDDDDDGRVHEDPRVSRGRPGTRAPHIFLERGGDRISTIDLFGRNFVLLTGPKGNAWRESGRDAAKQLGIELDIHQVGNASGLTDSDSDFLEAYGITPSGTVLVRPDGAVGWRAKKTSADAPAETISHALAALACIDAATRRNSSGQSVRVDDDVGTSTPANGAHKVDAEQPLRERVSKVPSRVPSEKTLVLCALAAGAVVTAAAWWRNRNQD